MTLYAKNKSIKIVLGEAKTTSDCDVTAAYADVTSTAYTDGSSDGVSNGVTATVVVASPAASTQRRVKELTVYNADTVPHTATIQYVDGASTRVLWKGLMTVGAFLMYANG